MITFEHEATRFTYRVAGVALHDEHVLLTRVEGYDWWFLPGGRAEVGETAAEALAREMREELGAMVEIERLLWVAEVFFMGELTGTAQHELGLYFLIRFAPDSPLYRRDGTINAEDGGVRLTFRWHALAALDGLTIYPLFLREHLRAIPAHPVHIAVRE